MPSIDQCNFQWPLSNSDFTGTSLFCVEYLRNGTRQTYSYNGILTGNTLLNGINSNDLEWLWVKGKFSFHSSFIHSFIQWFHNPDKNKVIQHIKSAWKKWAWIVRSGQEHVAYYGRPHHSKTLTTAEISTTSYRDMHKKNRYFWLTF